MPNRSGADGKPREDDKLHLFCAMAPGCKFKEGRTRAMNLAAAENFDVGDISMLPARKNRPARPSSLRTVGQSIIVGPPHRQADSPNHTAAAVIHEILR